MNTEKSSNIIHQKLHIILAALPEKDYALSRQIYPSPETAAYSLWETMHTAPDPQVNIVYAQSMFTGKTTVACLVSDLAGLYGSEIYAYQPIHAIRYGDKQRQSIITNDGLDIPAVTTDDNLQSVVSDVLARNGQAQKGGPRPLVVVDEAMLFLQQAHRPEEAVQLIKILQNTGHDVLLTGLTRTYRGEPFTFMQDLIDYAATQPGWNTQKMTTQCAHCDRVAETTRRYIETNGERRIARYGDALVVPGGKNLYEPVCGVVHISCLPDNLAVGTEPF